MHNISIYYNKILKKYELPQDRDIWTYKSDIRFWFHSKSALDGYGDWFRETRRMDGSKSLDYIKCVNPTRILGKATYNNRIL
jgi:hypothetical protein